MAIILSKPRELILNIHADSFTKLTPSGNGIFRHPVKEGTYPRSGISHPALAIGDHIEFSIVDNAIVHHAAGKFTVTEINLSRDPENPFSWDWVVIFERKKDCEI